MRIIASNFAAREPVSSDLVGMDSKIPLRSDDASYISLGPSHSKLSRAVYVN